jgi:hypothetical protein
MTLHRRTPLRKVSLKKEEKKRMFGKTEEELRKLYDTSDMRPHPSLPNTKINKYGTVFDTNSKKVAAFLSSGLVQKASEFTSKPRKMLKARSPNNPGWYNWAVENVWDKRDHKCEICDMTLDYGERPNPIVFSHLLERGSYRRYVRDAVNVRIVCPGHHGEWHNRPKGELIEPANPYHAQWRKMFHLEDELKREANNMKP